MLASILTAQARARVRLVPERAELGVWRFSCGCATIEEVVALGPFLEQWRGRVVVMCQHGALFTFLPLGDC
jgi:hypothetical protein